MSNAALDINIKANADQVLATIKKLQGKLDELKDKINSLPDGDKQLGKLSREFTRTALTQQKLIEGFDKLSNEVPPTTAKMEQTSDVTKRARNAFTSLNLVVQDLPFGFIAIQNNLPGLIQNFGLLTSELRKGTIPSTKELLTNLAGPAAFLAFSGVLAIVTKLTKEYGSLGNAIQAIVNGNQELVKAQTAFNKEIAQTTGETTAEAQKITVLTAVLTDLKKPLSERQAAYNELNKIQPGVIAGIDKENISSAESIKIIEANAKARLELIKLKAREASLTTVINQTAAKQLELEIARKPLIDALVKAQELYNLGVASGTVQAQKRTQALSREEIILYDARKALTDNIKSYNALVPVQDDFLKQLDPIILKISQINYNTDKQTESLKENTKERKENNKAVDEYLEKWKFLIQPVKPQKLPQVIIPNVGGPMANNLRSPLLPDEEDLKLYEDYYNQINKIIQDKTKSIASSIRRGIQQPLNEMFDLLLTKGKFTWESFGNAVIDVLKRIATQLIATGIASLVSNILAPGSGVAVAGALKGFSTQALGDYLELVPRANLSGVGGGMTLNGQVVFVQRGSDLVGVLNRTNATINRVG